MDEGVATECFEMFCRKSAKAEQAKALRIADLESIKEDRRWGLNDSSLKERNERGARPWHTAFHVEAERRFAGFQTGHDFRQTRDF